VFAVWPTQAAAQTSEADVSIAQAILEYDAKNYPKALEYLKEALAADPKNAEAHYYTGLILAAQQKPGEAIAALEKARTAAPTDLAILYQLGLAYFGQKEYGKAQGPLEQVFKAAPKTDGVGYYLGHVKFKRDDYTGALAAFRAGASTDPDIQQLTRVYAGYALAAQGKPAEADAEIKQGLAVQGATAVPTTLSDRLKQGVSTAAAADRRFHAEVQFGILYDTNTAVLPRPSRDPAAEFIREDRPTDSFGETFGVSLGYTFLKTGPWQADVGFSFFRVNYNDEPKFNTNNYLFSIGGSYRDSLLGMPWQLSAQYSYDDTTLAGDAFLSRHTASASWTLVENAGNLSALQVRYQNLDFSQIDNDVKFGTAKDAAEGRGGGLAGNLPPTPLTAEFRSANNWLFGIVHLFRFEADRHYIRLGFQYDAEKADGRNYSYDGFRYLVGGQYTLPWYKIRTKYDFDLHQRYYRNKNTLLNNDIALGLVTSTPFCHRCPFTREREDTEQNHTITIEAPLPYSTTLTLQQLWTAVNSNIDVYAFDRSVTSLSLSWRY
jgi:Tfp pilus assembly protein PilF